MIHKENSITKSLKVCLISTLFIIGLLVTTDSSFARAVRAGGSVHHSTRRTTSRTSVRPATTTRRTNPTVARSSRRMTIQPVRRPRGTVRTGRRISRVPAGHRTVAVRGSNYFYRSGVYYRQVPSGEYMAVAAPVGAVLDRLPSGYTIVYSESEPYYYYNGDYYVETYDGYNVVVPPSGATVPYLPAGYTTVGVNGVRHYAYGGVRYRPYSYRGRIVYRVM